VKTSWRPWKIIFREANFCNMPSLPWTEKYRPQSLRDIVGQEHVVEPLRNMIAGGRVGGLPHLFLFGPPGTGKTSVALALAQDLYGPTLWRARTLELNASDERGIQVIRDKVSVMLNL
jgi:replication factor C subunit 2/4